MLTLSRIIGHRSPGTGENLRHHCRIAQFSHLISAVLCKALTLRVVGGLVWLWRLGVDQRRVDVEVAGPRNLSPPASCSEGVLCYPQAGQEWMNNLIPRVTRRANCCQTLHHQTRIFVGHLLPIIYGSLSPYTTTAQQRSSF